MLSHLTDLGCQVNYNDFKNRLQEAIDLDEDPSR